MHGSRLPKNTRQCTVRCSTRNQDHARQAIPLPQLALAAIAAATLTLNSAVAPMRAEAVLNSPNAQIARTVDAALRRSTPAFNAQVKDIQERLEGVQFQLRIPQRKPWYGLSCPLTPRGSAIIPVYFSCYMFTARCVAQPHSLLVSALTWAAGSTCVWHATCSVYRGGMSKNVRESLELVSDKAAMMRSVPSGQDAEAMSLISSLQTQLEKLQFAIERKDIDRTSTTVASSLATVAQLEIVQACLVFINMPLLLISVS